MNIIHFLKTKYIQVAKLAKSDDLPLGAFIYLNPFNYFYLRKNLKMLDVAHYRMDGIYLVTLMRLFLPKKLNIERQSFDMTSLAPLVLEYCARNKLKVFIAGGKEGQGNQFIHIMNQNFNDINWVGTCSGYLSEEDIISEVLASKADVALLGLGNIKQESVAGKLAISNPHGRFFTCGAFISQTAKSGAVDYYPVWINRYHLRWAYRFVKEPHVIKRVIQFYPLFFFCFLLDLLKS